MGVYNVGSSSKMTDVTATASGSNISYGVRNSVSSPTMTNVTASASDAGANYGVHNSSSSPAMTNVTASASGGGTSYGVYNRSSSPTMASVAVVASGGTTNYGIYNTATSDNHTVRVDNSQVAGSTATIYGDSHFTVLVGATLLDGGAVAPNGGTITCAGVYDEGYVFSASTCP